MGTIFNVVAVYIGTLCLFVVAGFALDISFNVATTIFSPAVVASIFLVTGLSEVDPSV